MSYTDLPENLPVPVDDGACDHLPGRLMPALSLASSDGGRVDLGALPPGRLILYCYPMTGTPGRALPEGWDAIPGARGCTPQACGFRDHAAELARHGARVMGLSTQDPATQRELAERLHLPFPVLSDEHLDFARALDLPTFLADGVERIARLTLVVDDGRIVHVFYPVFPPDQSAQDVLDWLEAEGNAGRPGHRAWLVAASACGGLGGYPAALFRRVGHPVTWLGGLIGALDLTWNRDRATGAQRRRSGFVALFVVLAASVASAVAITVLADMLPPAIAALLLGVLASSCLAQRSLDEHVRAVRDALASGGVLAGRAAVARIVGRDTAALDASGVARAAIESLAENFSDGIVAPALFLALGGLPGGLAYKAVNTADSMIGHRTPRHGAFGFAAAKLDDVVNWPAARLAGLWIVLAAALRRDASAREAWRIMCRDARGHPSPNAGWPEAAMAGALRLRLGGVRSYGGAPVEDAAMGDGAPPGVGALDRALALYRLACALNAAAIVLAAILIALWR